MDRKEKEAFARRKLLKEGKNFSGLMLLAKRTRIAVLFFFFYRDENAAHIPSTRPLLKNCGLRKRFRNRLLQFACPQNLSLGFVNEKSRQEAITPCFRRSCALVRITRAWQDWPRKETKELAKGLIATIGGPTARQPPLPPGHHAGPRVKSECNV